jgi:hypothetical protein
MSDGATNPSEGGGNVSFPLTKLIIDLMKATPARRAKAEPERVAKKYGVPVATAKFYIDEARRTHEVWPIKETRG